MVQSDTTSLATRGFRMTRWIAAVVALLVSMSASAAECAGPPVVNARGAICLARHFVERSGTQQRGSSYSARQTATEWLVSYRPTDNNVKGGGGELRVDKATGEVSVVQLYR